MRDEPGKCKQSSHLIKIKYFEIVVEDRRKKRDRSIA